MQVTTCYYKRDSALDDLMRSLIILTLAAALLVSASALVTPLTPQLRSAFPQPTRTGGVTTILRRTSELSSAQAPVDLLISQDSPHAMLTQWRTTFRRKRPRSTTRSALARAARLTSTGSHPLMRSRLTSPGSRRPRPRLLRAPWSDEASLACTRADARVTGNRFKKISFRHRYYRLQNRFP